MGTSCASQIDVNLFIYFFNIGRIFIFIFLLLFFKFYFI